MFFSFKQSIYFKHLLKISEKESTFFAQKKKKLKTPSKVFVKKFETSLS